MLDFFVIFSKSGIVLFATVNDAINDVINKLIKHVILEERRDDFTYENLTLKYQLDNEYDIVFVIGYQKMLTLSYVDKFLSDIQLAFRDKYNDYDLRSLLTKSGGRNDDNDIITEDGKKIKYNLVDFYTEYKSIYIRCTKMQQKLPEKEMRTYQQSAKSKKTVGSMIIKKGEENLSTQPTPAPTPLSLPKTDRNDEPKPSMSPRALAILDKSPKASKGGDKLKKSKKEKEKKAKEARQWDLTGRDTGELDFSSNTENGSLENCSSMNRNIAAVTGGKHGIIDEHDMRPNLEMNYDSSDDDEEEEEEETRVESEPQTKSSFFGSIIKSFSYNKVLERSDLKPILAQLRDHLIAKNVAAEIAARLCDSVCDKLEGQQVKTWTGLKSYVKASLEESLLRILSPNRNLNILRDIKAKKLPPYVIVFCGVNGVGKSTNLAKIANWLVVNDNRVLVIAGDTFRAGAIEQLRVHVTALKTIHEKDTDVRKIDIYEKGYGKSSADVAMEAINYARQSGYNVCLVDTAGRMQGNEPLMKQLAKLIKVIEPDLTLFVGEALVGNEAVDQLTKFNNALVDNGCRGVNSEKSCINGIVLTKFDTIDDQVGAAISMTYITGQPIVFVGVGQNYRDLKQLNAKAVCKALMK